MLVLSRKTGQRIRIGEDIVVSVELIRGGSRVHIGVKAPKEVRIVRDELPPLPPREVDSSDQLTQVA